MANVVREFPQPAMAYMAESKEVIKKFKDKHKGERCFIIGTGPSLNKTNLSLIKDEIIFGVNLLYRGYDTLGIKSTYYCLADHRIMHLYKDIAKLHEDVFLSCSAWSEFMLNMGKYKPFGNPHLIEKIGTGCSFSYDMSEGCYWGGTVIFDPVLQLAYYMGFDEVYLLGCDTDYSGPQQYFDSTQKNSGIPNYSHINNAYTVAKKVYDDNGKVLVNCTVGGKLEVLTRMSLEEVMGIPVAPPPPPPPPEIDDSNRQSIITYWVKHVRLNNNRGIRWYQGIPYSWWHGMTDVQFIEALPDHVNDEETQWKTMARL